MTETQTKRKKAAMMETKRNRTTMTKRQTKGKKAAMMETKLETEKPVNGNGDENKECDNYRDAYEKKQRRD